MSVLTDCSNNTFEQHVVINKIHNNNGKLDVLGQLRRKVKDLATAEEVRLEIDCFMLDAIQADNELDVRLKELQKK